MKTRAILVTALLIGTPTAAFNFGDVIDEPTRIIDGDTLNVDGIRARLNGNSN